MPKIVNGNRPKCFDEKEKYIIFIHISTFNCRRCFVNKRNRMAVKQLVYLLILLVLYLMIYEAATQQCSSNEGESSILGMMLRRHIFKKIMGVSLGHVCLRECYLDARCQSFNFVISKDVCELNNRTKEARPDDFVPNFDRYYFRRDWNRGELL